MEKKKKILLISTISLILLLLVGAFIYQKYYIKSNNERTDENKIPEIKEDFKSVTFKELRVYENSYIYYDSDTKNIIRETEGKDYYIGTYGKLYTTPIEINYEEEYDEHNDYAANEYDRCGNYSMYAINDNEGYYIKNRLTNQKTDTYSLIGAIYFDKDGNDCRYYAMENYGKNLEYYIFDTYDESIYQFDDNVKDVNPGISQEDSATYSLYNHSNLTVQTAEDNQDYTSFKWGLTDYKTNYIIEPKYQELYIYDETLLVAKLNNKYGIIDTNDKVILPLEYDGIEILDDYIVVIKNNKLGVLDKKYNVIVNYEINYDNREEFLYELCCAASNAYYATEENGDLIIKTMPMSGFYYPEEEVTLEDLDKYNYYYVVNKNGIQKTLKGGDYSIDENYIILTEMNESTVTYSFYDKKYNLQAKFTIKPSHPEITFYPRVENVNRNYYDLGVYYVSDDEVPPTDVNTYVDPVKKEKVNKSDTEYYYFDNGYSYRMESNKLSVFKNNELLNSIDEFNYIIYIGDYMFVIADNSEIYTTNRIIKVIFNKES